MSNTLAPGLKLALQVDPQLMPAGAEVMEPPVLVVMLKLNPVVLATVTALLVASVDPLALVAVTRQDIDAPASSAVNRYVSPVAPVTATPFRST